jgi:hypothetical protein
MGEGFGVRVSPLQKRRFQRKMRYHLKSDTTFGRYGRHFRTSRRCLCLSPRRCLCPTNDLSPLFVSFAVICVFRLAVVCVPQTPFAVVCVFRRCLCLSLLFVSLASPLFVSHKRLSPLFVSFAVVCVSRRCLCPTNDQKPVKSCF